MNDIKAILWDNDGVLVDTEKLYFQANFEILKTLEIALDLEMYRLHFLVDGLGLIKIMSKLGFEEDYIEEIRAKRNAIYSDLLRAGDSLIPGVLNTLETLSKKYRMGIVTGSRKDHFEIIHANTNVLQYMEFVVAQGDYINSKPFPDPYFEGIKRMGLKPEECLAIEDTERGLISAKNAGLQCWVIPNEESKKSDFSRADKRLNNVEEVREILA